MNSMKSEELIRRYIEFFVDHSHVEIAQASLAQTDDASTLFTSAGMQQLVPYFSGEPHPAGRRLVDVQRCLRTDDIDEVGDMGHLTFFEMLGNWSLGDYFKEGAIELSFAFLTEVLAIPMDRLWISVFGGDEDAPRDEVSAAAWQAVGIPPDRIVYLGKKDNWWGPVGGNTGPCGPDTEMFVDTGLNSCGAECQPGCDCERFLEVWNDVFIQYNRMADGRYEPLPQQNVDTGMGTERMTAVLQGVPSPFETDLFRPIVDRILDMASEVPSQQSIRIMADHLRGATFAVAEHVVPSNKRHGYIVRRLIRRAIDHGRRSGIEELFSHLIAECVIDSYKGRYPFLAEEREFVLEAFRQEEIAFDRTLRRGRREFEGAMARLRQDGLDTLPGDVVFHLFDTYGVPPDLTREWAAQGNIGSDMEGFERAFEVHREISGAGTRGEYAGGLASRDDTTIRLHTATHLLQQALREVLGDHVAQKGSHITSERLRFDFSHPAKVTAEEIQRVERIVNDMIGKNLAVRWEEMSLEEASASGAIGLFGERYGEAVKVYSVGEFSKEICGGPHVDSIGQLGHFRVAREQSSGAGVRRIRAVLEQADGNGGDS